MDSGLEYYKKQNTVELRNLNIPIYKYIPFHYLRDTIKSSSLYFDRVSSWEDVYENWFLKETFMKPDGIECQADNLIPGVFGQSWTLKEESDAMWRIYSPLKRSKDGSLDYLKDVAVRVKTTAKKLFDVYFREEKDMANAFIGKVWYLSDEAFRNLQDSMSPLSHFDINEALYSSYFFKREPFKHEEEVRAILIFARNQEKFDKKGITYPIDCDNLFDEMVVDPRLNHEEYVYIRAQLMSLGVRSDKIKQSLLYRIEPHTIMLAD